MLNPIADDVVRRFSIFVEVTRGQRAAEFAWRGDSAQIGEAITEYLRLIERPEVSYLRFYKEWLFTLDFPPVP